MKSQPAATFPSSPSSSPAGLRIEADRFIAARAERWRHVPRRIPGGEHGVNPIRCCEGIPGVTSPADLGRAGAMREELADALRAVRSRLLDGRELPRGPLDEIVDVLIDLAARHADSLPALAFADAAPARDAACSQAVATAALSVAGAVALGWSRADVRDAAMVALLADFGLAALTFDPFALARSLTEVERSQLAPHGDVSALLASRIDGLADRVLLAVSQHHERPDGRGTPRGVKGGAIHDIALLVAAAGTLAAIASPRAHRPALRPHAALMHTAQAAREGALDEGMTGALIRACGTYPPGSHIRLSTGDIAVVVARPARSDLARPVVRVMPFWGAANFAAIGKPVTVNLADEGLGDVRIVEEVEPG